MRAAARSRKRDERERDTGLDQVFGTDVLSSKKGERASILQIIMEWPE
jgi:hypothetical protein